MVFMQVLRRKELLAGFLPLISLHFITLSKSLAHPVHASGCLIQMSTGVGYVHVGFYGFMELVSLERLLV